MAVITVNKTLDVRWLKRYRYFCVIGCVILAIQVFLAYLFLTIELSYENGAQETLSGRERYSVESLLDDRHNGESSRRFRDFPQDDDEEDAAGNSIGLFHRVKLPPDKVESAPKYRKAPVKSSSDKNKKRGSLRLEDLGFVPTCEITNAEAISAINRARTDSCKQEIANISCLMFSGELYPDELPHSCPAPGLIGGKLLGCYQDNKSSRLLPEFYSNFKDTNSPSNCIHLCLQSGFPYAGVQSGKECYCGNEEPSETSRLPDSSCNLKCPGNPKEACGGEYTMNIYQTGVAKFVSQVPKEGVPLGKTPPVRIAFLLTLNGRSVRQVKRLIKTLFHRDHFFYIHVDARQDYLVRELRQLELRLGNVRLSHRRHATIWGGASLLTVLLEGMTELINSAWDWDFVINLSESDFPVKTNTQLVEFLTANKDKNFVKSHGRDTQKLIQKQGLDKSFVECEAHMWRVGDRKLPLNTVIDGGSDWLALSRPFVHYLVTSPNDPLLKGLSTIFKHTLLPAESFFHTALRNSPFCETYVDNNLHVTNWKRKLGCKCQYKHIVDWCGCSPNNFKPDDWSRLKGTESRSVFFARKFEPLINQEVINKVDEWIYGPYPENMTGLNSYWQSIYHEADLSPGPDDALLTIGNALIRLASKAVSSFSRNCSVTPWKLVEIHSFMVDDKYKGSLVGFEGKVRNYENPVVIESLIQPSDHLVIKKRDGPGALITSLTVTTDYDQKEQTSRNFLRILGPFSEIGAAYRISIGDGGFNVSLIWVDPTGSIADVSSAYLDETAGLGFAKSSVKTPLLPGVWELKMVWNSSLVAHTKFLVVPLQFHNRAPLSQQQAKDIHSGSGSKYSIYDTEWTNYLSIGSSKKKSLERKAFNNAKRVGRDLYVWIDSLIYDFYSVRESCLAMKSIPSHLKSCGLSFCNLTSWSSHSPDPKSEVVSVDKTSGRIRRW